MAKSSSSGVFASFFSKILQIVFGRKIKKLNTKYEKDPRLVKAGNEYFEAKDNLEKAIFDLEQEIAASDELLKKLEEDDDVDA